MRAVNARGVEFAVEDVGSGPPVLLIHGFPLTHAMWSGQIEHLSGSHRVIAPDLRGFGKSEATSGKVGMLDFADDLWAILDALEIREPVRVVGFSMGGYIAFAMWRRARARIAKLALVDTRASADTPEAASQRLALAERVLVEGHEPIIAAMLEKLLRPRTLTERPDLVERTRAMFHSNTPAGIAAALAGLAERDDCTGLLGEMDVPALVIVGEEDGISPPEEMRAMAEAMPRASFTLIPGAGHMAPLENPEAVNAALSDLA